MNLLSKLARLFFIKTTSTKNKMSDLEKYILSYKPDSLQQVEWLQKQYTNQRGKYYDKLFY